MTAVGIGRDGLQERWGEGRERATETRDERGEEERRMRCGVGAPEPRPAAALSFRLGPTICSVLTYRRLDEPPRTPGTAAPTSDCGVVAAQSLSSFMLQSVLYWEY
jgi:hypothetical protein